MPVPAIELRPRGPVALIDAALHLCAQSTGLWSLALTGGAVVTAAALRLVDAIERHEPMILPSLLFALAWFARGLCQGAACHYVEHLVLDPAEPSPWTSLRAAFARAPSLFVAAGVLAVLNAVSLTFTLGLGFFFFTAHLVGYAATLRGVGSPLALYGTCGRLLGRAGSSVLGVRIALWAQVLVMINLHLGTATLLYLGRKLLALDLTFADHYASLKNPAWLLTLCALGFSLMEPLRAAAAALLLIDGRVRQEGLDLLAALEQLPRRQRAGSPLSARSRSTGVAAMLALLLCLSAPARAQETDSRPAPSTSQELDSEADSDPEPRPAPSNLQEAVERLERVSHACGQESEDLSGPLTAARELDDRERSPLVRFLNDVESLAYDDQDCEAAMARLRSGLPQIVQVRAARAAERSGGAAEAARRRAREILSRPEFESSTPPAEASDAKVEPKLEDEHSWWSRFKRWLRELLEKWLREPPRRQLPISAVGTSGTLLANGLVIALVGAVLAVLAVLLFTMKPRKQQAGAALEAVAAGDTVNDLEGQSALSRPPESWASLADELAARGEFRLAIRSLYLALLSRLHREGAIDYDPAQSNWEYFRRFRGPRTWVPPFRELTLRFDYAWYGNTELGQEGYRTFRELSQPLLNPAPQPAAAPTGQVEPPHA